MQVRCRGAFILCAVSAEAMVLRYPSVVALAAVLPSKYDSPSDSALSCLPRCDGNWKKNQPDDEYELAHQEHHADG